MLDSGQILLSVAGAVAGIAIVAGTWYWRYNNQYYGTQLDITTASVAYKQNHTLSWNKHTLLINGKPVLLFSGEFHYWRIPDRERWREILTKYKAAGLNCIRIYFHWAFHSPSKYFIEKLNSSP
jgi:hypothetical protein